MNDLVWSSVDPVSKTVKIIFETDVVFTIFVRKSKPFLWATNTEAPELALDSKNKY